MKVVGLNKRWFRHVSFLIDEYFRWIPFASGGDFRNSNLIEMLQHILSCENKNRSGANPPAQVNDPYVTTVHWSPH
jgi:hypothetical protein